MQLSDLVAIGTLGKTLNRDGSVAFRGNASFISAFLTVPKVFLVFKSHNVRYMTITGIRNDAGYAITFAEKNDVLEAIEQGPAEVMLAREDFERVQKAEGLFDFVGMQVSYRNAIIGIVDDVMETKAHDILVVCRDDDTEVLIPVVEYYLEAIDPDQMIIYAVNLEGLLEL